MAFYAAENGTIFALEGVTIIFYNPVYNNILIPSVCVTALFLSHLT
jgi:hypothetical protein